MKPSVRTDPFCGPMMIAEPLDAAGRRFRIPSGELELPIHYDDASTVLTVLPTPMAALQALLPAPLRPRRVVGDMGALIVQFVDMPRTTIGPYRECAVSIAVREDAAWPRGDADWRPAPSYVLWLSVTSALARDSGQAIWGYPKVVAETEFAIRGRRFEGFADLGGGAVIDCAGTLPEADDWSRVEMRAITGRGDSLLRSVIHGRARVTQAEAGPDLRVRITPGSPITDALARLGWTTEGAAFTAVEQYTYDLTAPLGSTSHDVQAIL